MLYVCPETYNEESKKTKVKNLKKTALIFELKQLVFESNMVFIVYDLVVI
jgi:hypothetical protein